MIKIFHMPKKFELIAERNLKTTANSLLKLRRSLGWSQKQLASEFKVAPGTIALWELGRREIPGPVIKLIEIYSTKNIFMENKYE